MIGVDVLRLNRPRVRSFAYALIGPHWQRREVPLINSELSYINNIFFSLEGHLCSKQQKYWGAAASCYNDLIIWSNQAHTDTSGRLCLDKRAAFELEDCKLLEVTKPGHRKRILTSLGEKSTSRLFDELKDFSFSKMDWNLGTISGVSTADEPSSSGDESRTVDIMRGDTSIRNFATNGSLSRNESPPLVSALKIRPPTQLMGDTSPQQTLQDMPHRSIPHNGSINQMSW
ncbi:ankyrin repeat and SAM domain-containing protein 1A [Caerostris extrusa]|uniref:Ankyrin repeat and SAM domain-containing protein 1A n=1 Tax=Caerostris extrusa TaxID=172846 RepID=A0AAV4QCS9_CAEEX|nr:ankyrin repeat and SAM domain-containing protein 1A [Caerostris extrusa]